MKNIGAILFVVALVFSALILSLDKGVNFLMADDLAFHQVNEEGTFEGISLLKSSNGSSYTLYKKGADNTIIEVKFNISEKDTSGINKIMEFHINNESGKNTYLLDYKINNMGSFDPKYANNITLSFNSDTKINILN